MGPSRYVAVLRGINVGGHRKVAMADLRSVVEGLGHSDVATYVNSGNVVFTASSGRSGSRSSTTLAKGLERVIAKELGVDPAVIVRSAAVFRRDVAATPYADEPNPQNVHVVFFASAPAASVVKQARDAQQKVATTGSHDTVTFARSVAYIHTPGGFGRSKLVELLSRRGGPLENGTARNMSTAVKLLDLLDSS